MASGPDVSHALVGSGSQGMRSVGRSQFKSGAQMQLRPRCDSYIDRNLASVVNRPVAVFPEVTVMLTRIQRPRDLG